MEMRAREEVGLAQDLIPPIPPLASALHRRFLPSHCTACFRPVESPLRCSACLGAARYCSAPCFASDHSAHDASGECFLLSRSRCPDDDDTDLRVALRLLHSFKSMGPLPPASLPERPRRIAGLIASDLEKVLEEGSEVAERIREGVELMSLAWNWDLVQVGSGEAVMLEEVFWAVLTNAVEVQVSEVGALGVAVYGPGFSWFNHSCVPNSCYRFELGHLSGDRSSAEPESFLASPAAAGVAADSLKSWICGESRLTRGFSEFGPRVTLRSIKPIKKGEEIYITYIDLLQPKFKRQADLWKKYRVVCCCPRCSVSSEINMDRVLNCDGFGNYDDSTDPNCEELADMLDQAVAEYTADENPESCCMKLESILFQSSQVKKFQARGKFKLHPLHHLSLNAYIMLASAYRIRLFNSLIISLDGGNHSEDLKLGRAAVSYSLLLAGATHLLFLYEPSLIATTAHFLISAAESICSLLKIPECSFNKLPLTSEIDSVLCHYHRTMMEFSLDACNSTSMRFLECVSHLLVTTWPTLTQGLTYLENINSPVNFSWLGLNVPSAQHFSGRKETSDFIKHDCFECRERLIKDQSRCLFQLAVHCFAYGRYLASICYGPQCYLAYNVENLLHGLL